jgi:hypothetical protein
MKELYEHGMFKKKKLFRKLFSKRAKCQAGVMFAIKAELKRRPYLMLGILMFFTIVYLGMAMRTFEM